LRGRPRDLSHHLAEVPLFKGVNGQVLTRVVDRAHLTHMETGGFFFTEGDAADTFFVLTAGRAKLTQLAAEGHQVFLRLIGAGDSFGGAGVFGESTYPITAQAVEPSIALAWTSDAMRSVIKTEPIIAWNAVCLLSGQLQDLRRRYRQVLTERVERRVARALLRLSRDAGRHMRDGVEIDFAVSRRDIAEMTGTSLFTISRLMSSWEERGLVGGGRQHIILMDLQGLRDIAEDLSHDVAPRSAGKKRTPAADEDVATDELRDIVDEASCESFPASDPPPWTLGVPSH
jgi:CRP-like cAMP-binding protein